MRSLDLDECADYLKVDRTTVLKLAMQGVLPGAKIGRAWVFPEGELREFLSAEVKRQQAERRTVQNEDANFAVRVRATRTEPDAPLSKRRRGQRLPSYLQQLPQVVGES